MEHFELWYGIVFPYINFLIFFVALVWFARKPLANMVSKRRQDFDVLVKQSREAHEKAKAKHAEISKRMATLDKEVADIKNFTEEAARRDAERIVEDANRLASHLREEARRVADAEVERARQQIRSDIVESVRKVVEERIVKDLSKEGHLKLVQTKIADIAKIQKEARP